MTESVALVIYYVNSVIYAGMSYYGLTCMFKPAFKKRWILLAYASFVIISSQQFLAFNSAWFNLAVHLFSFSAISLLFSGSKSIKILYASTLYLLSLVADAISYVGLSYIYLERHGTELPQIYIYSIGRTVINIIYLPLLLMCVMVFRKFFTKKANSYSVVSIPYIASVFILLGGIILIDALFLVYAVNEYYVNIGLVVASQFVVLLIIFLVIWHYNALLDYFHVLEANKQKNRILEHWILQYNMAISSQKEISKMSHNLKYHFIALTSLLKNNKVKEAKIYLEERLGEISDNISTGNLPIDTMLNYYQQKIRQALGVDIEIDLMIPPSMKLDAELTATVLGNALENALEACAHVASGERYIRFKAAVTSKDNSNLLIITIANSYKVAPITDGNGNIITSKQDKRKHGIGLASIQEMFPEDVGYVSYDYADNIFRIMLIFYDVM